MEHQQHSGGRVGDYPLIVTIWRHSCTIHGEHMFIYGSDCPTTARHNARSLYEDCAEACTWTTPPREYVYDISSEAMAAGGDSLMPWEIVPREDMQ